MEEVTRFTESPEARWKRIADQAKRKRDGLIVHFVGPIFAALVTDPAQIDLHGNRIGRDLIDDAFDLATQLADETMKRFPIEA